MHTYLPTYTHIHTYIQYIHTCIHTYTHTYNTVQTHMHTYTYIHTYIHPCMYTHTYTYIHIHTYTHIHIQTLICTYIKCMENFSPLIITITTRSLQVTPDTLTAHTHCTKAVTSSQICNSAPITVKQIRWTRTAVLQRGRSTAHVAASVVMQHDVVRSTEPNLALKKRSKCTAHTTRKQAYMFCWETPCAHYEILTVLMIATEKLYTSAASLHNFELPRNNPFSFHRYAGSSVFPAKYGKT